ncbi:MAG: CotD family spore coat protein [Bacilli bacterium]
MLFGRRFGCCNNMMMDNCCPRQNECEREVIEPTINKCVEREFCHEVPHVCPIHTHVINRHIYKHTYTPQYTCSEENQVVNEDCGGCCGF